MKADILRRAEEFSSSEDEDEEDVEDDQLAPTAANKIKVLGDGEESDGSDSEGNEGDEERKILPETILELTYVENPKLLDRDSRGSPARADLKQKTGWADEQIEGWKSMLERDPKRKERVLRKHEWSGNKPGPVVQQSEGSSSRGNRGRGRGRGGGQGRGRGGAGGPDTARERAWKEKNKNRARKGGHDKKMARAGAGPPT